MNALAGLAPLAMNGTDYIDAQAGAQNFLANPSLPNALAFATPMVALAMPGVSARMAEGVADVGGDLARFATDDSGALPVFTGGSGNPVAAASDKGAWFSETEGLAEEYAGQSGRVMAADIDPQRPISFRHAEQRRPIGDLISQALEGAGDGVDFEQARPIVDRLFQRYGSEPKPLFEFWNNDKDVADLLRSLGYDAISVAEKADMRAQTWGVLNPSAISRATDAATGQPMAQRPPRQD